MKSLLTICLILIFLTIAIEAAEENYPYESRIPKSIKPALHLVIPLGISFGTAKLMNRWNDGTPLKKRCLINGFIGFLAGTAVTVIKEEIDHQFGYTRDADDYAVGITGAALGTCIYGLHEYLKTEKHEKEQLAERNYYKYLVLQEQLPLRGLNNYN